MQDFELDEAVSGVSLEISDPNSSSHNLLTEDVAGNWEAWRVL